LGGEVRKTFAARADLLEKLSELAERRGLTLYALVNQLFQLEIEVGDRGVDLRRVVEEWGEWVRVRNSGFMPVPAILWGDLVKEVYERSGEEWLVARCREVGGWLVKKLVSSGANPLQELEHLTRLLAPNSPELTFEARSENVRVLVMNPKLTKPHAAVLASIIEGALINLGYERLVKEVDEGFLRVEGWRAGHAQNT
jgi:hypothetical protein